MHVLRWITCAYVLPRQDGATKANDVGKLGFSHQVRGGMDVVFIRTEGRLTEVQHDDDINTPLLHLRG